MTLFVITFREIYWNEQKYKRAIYFVFFWGGGLGHVDLKYVDFWLFFLSQSFTVERWGRPPKVSRCRSRHMQMTISCSRWHSEGLVLVKGKCENEGKPSRWMDVCQSVCYTLVFFFLWNQISSWNCWLQLVNSKSRWWFQIFLYFHPYLGKWSNLTNIFQLGWNHQLEMSLAWISRFLFVSSVAPVSHLKEHWFRRNPGD